MDLVAASDDGRWAIPLMGKRAALKSLLLLAGGTGALLVLELGLRVYSALAFPKMMVLDDELGWKHAPRTAKAYRDELGESALMIVDANGLRGPEREVSKPAGVYRILVLGDSFTEGASIAQVDLFTARLERSFPQTEVLNAGVGAYGTVQEYLYLLDQGLQFQPDLAMLMFFENDLADNCLSYYAGFGPRPYATLADGELRLVRDLDPTKYLKYIIPVPFRLALNRHSYLYYFLNRQIYQRLRATEMQQWERSDVSEVDLATKHRIFFALIAETKNLLDRRRIDFFLVLIPSRREVTEGRSASIERILGFCRESGIRCLSLLERFRRESAAGEAPYYPVDAHWTKVGHRIAADEIGRHLPEVIARTRARSQRVTE